MDMLSIQGRLDTFQVKGDSRRRHEVMVRVHRFWPLWDSPEKYLDRDRVLVKKDEYERMCAVMKDISEFYLPRSVKRDLDLMETEC